VTLPRRPLPDRPYLSGQDGGGLRGPVHGPALRVLTAPPLGFGSRMQTVLGGTAYARISTGKIDIVDPSSGATCSTLSVPAGTFNVGGDGSLLYWDPEGRDRTTGLCTITVYPRVLR